MLHLINVLLSVSSLYQLNKMHHYFVFVSYNDKQKYALYSEYPISSGIPTIRNILMLKVDHEIVTGNAHRQMDSKPNPSARPYSLE